MNIKYEFITGEDQEVSVPDELINVVNDTTENTLKDTAQT